MKRSFWITGLFAALAPATGLAAPVPADAMRVPQPATSDALDEAATAKRVVVVPGPNAGQLTSDVRPQRLGNKILYVNFDGGDLNACGNNSPINNCTTIFPGTVLPYTGDAANRAAVIQVVRKRVEEFGISVTDQRPGNGDYDMEMVGNWAGSDPDFAGIAPGGDCWDNGGGDLSFTLEVSTSADAIAEIMLQELAHTWGLDHVDEQQDLLYPTTQGTNKTFRDECYQIVSDTDLTPDNGFCSHHQMACGTNSRQNSHDEMLLIHGPSVPDTVAPIVAILAPADGAVIDGSEFELEIGLQDDQLPAVINTTITLMSDALPDSPPSDGAFASPAELSFPISGLPNGEYRIVLEGRDESENAASDEITITIMGSDVGTEETGTADTTAADDDDDDGDDENGEDEEGDDDTGDDDGDGAGTTGLGATGGEAGTDSGCQCTSAGHERTSWAMGLVALLSIAAVGRRRSASC